MNEATLHVRQTKLFEWYAQVVWPVQRHFVKSQIEKRCQICTISSRCMPLIEGVCQLCREYKEARAGVVDSFGVDGELRCLEDELEEILHNHQHRGEGDYDALVLVSGGKDSALLLHELKRRYPGLRLLGCTVDNGFMSPVACENARSLMLRLGVDHLYHYSAAPLFAEVFRYALLTLGGRGCSEIVDRFDGDLLHDVGRQLAASMRIPLLISGVSWVQVEQIFGIRHFEMPREREFRSRIEQSPGLPKDLSRESQSWLWDPKRYSEDSVARFIFPGYVWRLNEQEIRNQVQELGLIRRGNESPLVTNSSLVLLMGVLDMHNLGYSSFEPEFSQLVRSGKTDRYFWNNVFELLDYCSKSGFMIRNSVEAVLDKLELSAKELGLKNWR